MTHAPFELTPTMQSREDFQVVTTVTVLLFHSLFITSTYAMNFPASSFGAVAYPPNEITIIIEYVHNEKEVNVNSLLTLNILILSQPSR